MIINHYSIFDKKALHYGATFGSPTHGSAERMLRDSVNQPDSIHSKHPDDFALYFVFQFDDESGSVLAPDHPPLLIAEASALTSA